jgi:branched-chain amino acid aminotransferase
MSNTTIIYNGNFVPSNQPCLDFNDRSFNLGHGIFETILIKEGSIPLGRYHWQRLQSSACRVGIDVPFNSQEFEFMLLKLIEQNKLTHSTAGARLTLSCGYSARGILPAKGTHANFVIHVFEHIPSTNKPYSALIVSTRKNEHSPTANIKSTSYMENILAKNEAISQGFDEAILLNSASHVADGAITNIFIVKNKKIYTPPVTDGALPGVIRRLLLEEFSDEFSIMEKSISAAELLDADEVFLTNALMGIQAVTKVNDIEYNHFSLTNSMIIRLRDIKNYP